MFRERILDVTLHRAAHRTSTVVRVVALLDEEFLGLLVELQVDVLYSKTPHDGVDFEIDDLDEILAVEHVENDLLVETVEELGLEGLLRLVEDLVPHRGVILVATTHRAETEGDLTLDNVGTHVGGEDDDGVTEIDLAAERVGDHALFQDLEEQVHDIRVGLLDFVEEHDGVGTAAHRLRELAALFIPDVAGRRTDEAAAREFLHVLGHVDLDERLLVAEHELGEVAGEVGLADSGGAEENERTDGTTRILEVGATAAQGAGDRDHGLVLTDDAALEFVFHLQELVRLLLLHPLEGNTGPLCDDSHDVVFLDGDDLLLVRGTPLTEDVFDFLALVFFLIAQGGSVFEILPFDRGLLLGHDLLDFGLEILDLRRARHRGDARAGSGFVENVDGLVGKETAGEVAG